MNCQIFWEFFFFAAWIVFKCILLAFVILLYSTIWSSLYNKERIVYTVLLETFEMIFHRGMILVFHHSSVNGRNCFHASFFWILLKRDTVPGNSQQWNLVRLSLSINVIFFWFNHVIDESYPSVKSTILFRVSYMQLCIKGSKMEVIASINSHMPLYMHAIV